MMRGDGPTVLVHVLVVAGDEALAISFEHHGPRTPVRLVRLHVAVLLVVCSRVTIQVGVRVGADWISRQAKMIERGNGLTCTGDQWQKV